MKRTTNIYIRVSEEEKAILLTLAAKEGLTISAWVRRLAYTMAPPLPPPPGGER